MKKILAIVLSVSMVMCLLPTLAFANDDPTAKATITINDGSKTQVIKANSDYSVELTQTDAGSHDGASTDVTTPNIKLETQSIETLGIGTITGSDSGTSYALSNEGVQNLSGTTVNVNKGLLSANFEAWSIDNGVKFTTDKEAAGLVSAILNTENFTKSTGNSNVILPKDTVINSPAGRIVVNEDISEFGNIQSKTDIYTSETSDNVVVTVPSGKTISFLGLSLKLNRKMVITVGGLNNKAINYDALVAANSFGAMEQILFNAINGKTVDVDVAFSSNQVAGGGSAGAIVTNPDEGKTTIESTTIVQPDGTTINRIKANAVMDNKGNIELDNVLQAVKASKNKADVIISVASGANTDTITFSAQTIRNILVLAVNVELVYEQPGLDLTLDKAALGASIGGNNISLSMNQIERPNIFNDIDSDDAKFVGVSLIADSKNIHDLNGGTAKITFKDLVDPTGMIGIKVSDKLNVYGRTTEVTHPDGLTLSTQTLSVYGIVPKAEGEAAIKATKDKATVTGVQATKVTNLNANKARGKVELSWSKTSGYKVDGYQVWKSTKKTSGFSKVKTTTKTKYLNTKGLSKGKTYYYKVRGYRTVNGEKVYTGFTKLKVIAK